MRRKEKKILIKQISYNNIASAEEDPIAISVEENNFVPILAAFEIKNKEKDRFLIDVTNHFMADSPGFNIIRKGDKDRYKIGGVDKKRSSIDSAKSFPKNTEIRHTLTFKVNKPRVPIVQTPLVFKSIILLLFYQMTPCAFAMKMKE